MKLHKDTDLDSSCWNLLRSILPPWYVLIGGLIACMVGGWAAMYCIFMVIDRIKQ